MQRLRVMALVLVGAGGVGWMGVRPVLGQGYATPFVILSVDANKITFTPDPNVPLYLSQILTGNLISRGDGNTLLRWLREDANTSANNMRSDANASMTKLLAQQAAIYTEANAVLTAALNRDYVISAVYRVVIDGNSRLLTDPNTAGLATVPANLVRLALAPEAGTTDHIRFTLTGAASGTASAEWMDSGVDGPLTPATAGTAQFVSTGGTIYATLFVMTRRN
jgi:hypothetical protein